jgi:hypothetical protein
MASEPSNERNGDGLWLRPFSASGLGRDYRPDGRPTPVGTEPAIELRVGSGGAEDSASIVDLHWPRPKADQSADLSGLFLMCLGIFIYAVCLGTAYVVLH